MKRKLGLLMIIFISIFMILGCDTPWRADDENKEITVIHADYPHYDDAKELTDTADLVFSGKVIGISYEMIDIRTDDGPDPVTGYDGEAIMPYTIFEIEIDEIFKGSWSDSVIHIQRLGGHDGDITYELADAPEIVKDESYLFIANEFEDYPSLVNIHQSVYNIDHSGNDNPATLDEILALFN